MSDDELGIIIRARTHGPIRCCDAADGIIIPPRLCGTIRTTPSGIIVPARTIEPIRFVGHEFAPSFPVLMTGPSAVPGLTTAVIYWTTDVPAYHRVRIRTNPTGAWTTLPFTGSPSTNAAYPLTGLIPENKRYYVDVQSCIIGDGSASFPWTPDDNSFYFATLCSGVYGMANWNAAKNGFGKLTYLTLSWTTTVNMYQAQIDSSTPALCYGPWNSSDMTHGHDYMSFDFSKPGTYYWRTRNRNKCFIWCSYSAWQSFVVTAGGGVIPQ